ncbi:hypothetical protein L6452_24556 [Arctium lappa]|uniref:Uncharacterized protein n=1 Tax=Arctium lappa TaxID=4217 RepID=A0ACB9A9Y2_ARCLA|nr:hypothetical protein L6452_24556 [Arctium lappa]
MVCLLYHFARLLKSVRRSAALNTWINLVKKQNFSSFLTGYGLGFSLLTSKTRVTTLENIRWGLENCSMTSVPRHSNPRH